SAHCSRPSSSRAPPRPTIACASCCAKCVSSGSRRSDVRRLAALTLVVVLLAALAQPADACGSPCGVAIGLASFFFLSALLAPFAYPSPSPSYPYPSPYAYPAYPAYSAYPAYTYATPAAAQPPVVYTAPVVYRAPAAQSPAVHHAPASAQVRVVQSPHGRYELRGDGVTTAYQWVWVVTAEPTSPALAEHLPASLPLTTTR